MARRGRRPGGSAAREAILDAARQAFASHGYDRATIRMIAGNAGVDPALVHHYFGTKEDLFAAAIDVPFRPAELLDQLLEDGVGDAGERLARVFFTIWESPTTREALLGQLRFALTTGETPAIAGFASKVVLHRVASHLDGEDRELRAELVASHLLGLAILRYVARMEPVASTPIDRLVEIIAPRIQTYLTPEPGGGW